MLQSHELVPERRFLDHIEYYRSGVNFNKFVCSRLCNVFEPIFVYGDWMIHCWLKIDLGKMIFLMNFYGSWFLQIVFLRFLNEFWPIVVAATRDVVSRHQARARTTLAAVALQRATNMCKPRNNDRPLHTQSIRRVRLLCRREYVCRTYVHCVTKPPWIGTRV